MTSFEEILARDGVLAYKTKGVSMEPMLRQNRDLVVIEAPSSKLQKYDVALYRRKVKPIHCDTFAAERTHAQEKSCI